MTDVPIRELRNHGGDVVDRVLRGERTVATRAGRPVAGLEPLARPITPLEVLRDRRKRLPLVDPIALRRDVDTSR